MGRSRDDGDVGWAVGNLTGEYLRALTQSQFLCVFFTRAISNKVIALYTRRIGLSNKLRFVSDHRLC